MSESLQLSQIVTDAGTQIRAAIDAETVANYAAAMIDGAKFPPVTVFHDGSRHLLADGFHRVMAAARNGFHDILADVRLGTKADALMFALGANARHGLRRTNADKRRCVELAIAEWPGLSDRKLAEICAVSDALVSDVREAQVQESRTCPPAKRVGADGKSYPASRKTPSAGTQHRPDAPQSQVGEHARGTHPSAPDTAAGGATNSDAEPPLDLPAEDDFSAVYDLARMRADLAYLLDNVRRAFIDPDEVGHAILEFQVAQKQLRELQAKLRTNP